VIATGWNDERAGDLMDQALRRTVQRVILNTLLDLGGDARATAEVRAGVEYALASLSARIERASGGGAAWDGHRSVMARDLGHYFAGEDDPAARPRFPVVPLPWP
jgi:hypothetical protein